MTIAPVNFLTASPVRAADPAERVKRRRTDETKSAGSGHGGVWLEPMPAALEPEEMASDATREALQSIRLGG